MGKEAPVNKRGHNIREARNVKRSHNRLRKPEKAEHHVQG